MQTNSAVRVMGLALAICLSACGQPTPEATPTNTAPAADGYGAKVAALSPALRAGVLLRAIVDAGQTCQKVVDAVRASATGGPPAWVATCDDQRRWVVVIGNDGTATVVDAKDVARIH